MKWLPPSLWSASASQIVDIAEACLWLVLTRVCLAALPFRWVIFLSNQLSRSESRLLGELRSEMDLVSDVRIGLERAVRRLPWQSSCLVQALAGRAMLFVRGLASELMIGVKSSKFEAHAWLCSNGAPVAGNRLGEEYTLLAQWK